MGKCLSTVNRRLHGQSQSSGQPPSVNDLHGVTQVDLSPDPLGRKKSNQSLTSDVSLTSSGGARSRKSSTPVPPKPPAKTVSTPRDGLIVRALYDFQAINPDDLAFMKGDRLKVDETGTQLDWWLATHLKTLQKGYIPHNYVKIDDNSPQAQEQKSQVLSVRHEDRDTGDPVVKHYRIKRMDDGGYYISPKKQFQDLFELIEFYSSDTSSSLCARLSEPCPRLKPFEMRFDELEIERSDIELEVRLGHGHFGEVWKGKLKRAADVAVKTLKTGTMSRDDFLREAEIMHKLRHKKLVNLLAVCSRSEPIWIVTELMVNGALLDYLRKDSTSEQVKFPMLVKMAAQVADGMAYLEAQNFVHRDLRAANILVGEHHDVKVADFGLARILDQDDTYDASDNAKFPIKWTAPEAGLQRKFSVKSDVWSFGILLYEIFTYGRVPYPGVFGDILQKVEAGYRMSNPSGMGKCMCPEPIYDIMKKCWSAKPADRPTFEFLKSFFEDYVVSSEQQYE